MLPNLIRSIIASLILSISLHPVAFAVGFAEPPPLTNREKAHQNIIFTGGGNESAGECSEDSSSANLTGSDNAEKIYNFLRSKGLSPEQAAGAWGNISVESGSTFDPQIVQFGFTPARTDDPTKVSVNSDGNQGGWGIIQWTPAKKVVEPDGGLMKKANITTPPGELGSQLNLIWWHMTDTTPTGVRNFLNEYKGITDVATATESYMIKMEAPGIPHLQDRINRAKEALRKYEGGGSGTTPTPTESVDGCSNSSDGGVASVDGFTFPLITTQKAITSHKPYPWCHAALKNCHHDYKAADIMIETGTTVIAAKSGTVVSSHAGNQHPNNVTIKTDDGKGINYYTHLGANTLKVRDGQHVDASDVLGKVGTSKDAMGTDPHLHFDMLPPAYEYRVSCSGASCTRYPFIEVQPALVETFKKLPPG